MLTTGCHMPNRASKMTELVLALFRANGALLAMGDALVEPLGLTSARWQVLGAIALAEDPQTVPAIARAMGLTRQGVQKQVDRLLEEGRVVLTSNPSHRSSPLVSLTSEGRSTYAKADRKWNERAQQLASHHKLEQLEAARGVLHRLVRSLEDSTW